MCSSSAPSKAQGLVGTAMTHPMSFLAEMAASVLHPLRARAAALCPRRDGECCPALSSSGDQLGYLLPLECSAKLEESCALWV